MCVRVCIHTYIHMTFIQSHSTREMEVGANFRKTEIRFRCFYISFFFHFFYITFIHSHSTRVMVMGARFRKTEIMGTARCLMARVEE